MSCIYHEWCCSNVVFLDLKQTNIKESFHVNENSMFYKLGQSGLISFSDYIFLLTLLSSKYTSQTFIFNNCSLFTLGGMSHSVVVFIYILIFRLMHTNLVTRFNYSPEQ